MEIDYQDKDLMPCLEKIYTQEQFNTFYKTYLDFFKSHFGNFVNDNIKLEKQAKSNIYWLIGYFNDNRRNQLATFMLNYLFPDRQNLIGKCIVYDTDTLSFSWQNGEYIIDEIESEFRVRCHDKNNPERNNISINLLGEIYFK